MRGYRLFDKEENKYHDFTKIPDGVLTGYLVLCHDGTICSAEVGGLRDVSDRYIKEDSTGLKDKNGIEGCAGDLRIYHGKRYKVVDDLWRFRFERNLVEFGENEDIQIGEDEMYESEIIGNIHK